MDSLPVAENNLPVIPYFIKAGKPSLIPGWMNFKQKRLKSFVNVACLFHLNRGYSLHFSAIFKFSGQDLMVYVNQTSI